MDFHINSINIKFVKDHSMIQLTFNQVHFLNNPVKFCFPNESIISMEYLEDHVIFEHKQKKMNETSMTIAHKTI